MRKLLILVALISFLFPVSAKADDTKVYRSTWESIQVYQEWWDSNHNTIDYDFFDAKTNIAFSLFNSAIRDGYLGQNITHVQNGYTWGIKVTDDTSDFWGLLIETHGDWYFLDPDPDKLLLKKIRL